MSAKVFISRDSGALCVSADEVARALFKAAEKRGLDVEIVRTGSRGMYWLEPTIEIARPEGRIGYGPVKPSDIDSLLDAGMLDRGKHPLSLGLVEDIPFFKKQTRLTFARVGIIDPRSLEDYKAHGGCKGWRRRWPPAQMRSSRRWSIRACAAVAARASPPASNGAPSPKPLPSRNTSSATPMRAIQAPSPTA
jgi:hypothetical protein